MRTLVGAIVGVLAAAGVWIAVAGCRGVADPDRRTRHPVDVDGLLVARRRLRRRRVRRSVRRSPVGPRRACWPARAAWVAPMLIGVRAGRDG